MSRLLTDDVDNLRERLSIDDYLWLMKSPDFARVVRFLQAQDAMTIKAVGEWLADDCCVDFDKCRYVIWHSQIKALLRGEMPEG